MLTVENCFLEIICFVAVNVKKEKKKKPNLFCIAFSIENQSPMTYFLFSILLYFYVLMM